jgi:hypothetical protein
MSILLVLFVLGLIGYAIGKNKGMGWVGFLLGAVLGPIGWLIIGINSGDKIKCPQCKQSIHFQASICPFCKTELSPKK